MKKTTSPGKIFTVKHVTLEKCLPFRAGKPSSCAFSWWSTNSVTGQAALFHEDVWNSCFSDKAQLPMVLKCFSNSIGSFMGVKIQLSHIFFCHPSVMFFWASFPHFLFTSQLFFSLFNSPSPFSEPPEVCKIIYTNITGERESSCCLL